DCFIVDAHGRDNGLRFVDINEDGFADVIVSNEKSFSLNLFVPEVYLGFKLGWSREVLRGKVGQASRLPLGRLAEENVKAGETPALLSIPMITRNGSNNGAWFHSRHLWVQNEDTSNLPDKVDRRSFDDLLTGLQPPPLSPEDSLK